MTGETGQTPGEGGGAAAALGTGTGAEHPAGTGATPPPAGSEVTVPWATQDGSAWNIGDKPWYEAIPEEGVRQTMAAKGYKNPAEAAMGYHNLLKLQNGNPNVVSLPGEDATPEQIKAFHKALGAPDTPDGYKFEFGEGQQVDESMLTFGRGLFHELGLNNKQAQAAANKWNEFVATQQQQLADTFRTENEAEVNALKAKHGDNYNAFLEAGKRVVGGAKISNETIQKMEASMGTAAVLDLLCSIGASSKEDGFNGGGTGTGQPAAPEQMTPQQAQAEITKLNNDADFQKAYTDKNDPGHKDAVDKMQRLYSRL